MLEMDSGGGGVVCSTGRNRAVGGHGAKPKQAIKQSSNQANKQPRKHILFLVFSFLVFSFIFF
jgi:hypothetical protein